MAQPKTKSRSVKKDASKFYIVRTIRDLQENMTDRVETAHREFIKEPLESGREVMADFRKDPGKTLNGLVDDGRRFVEDLSKDTRKRVKGVVADSRKFYRKAKKHPRKTLDGIVDDGRDVAQDLLEEGKSFMNGVEKDARLVWDEWVDDGKKALDNLPGKKTFQKSVEKRLKSVPLQFNLPTRRDVDLLTGKLEALTVKIDTLGKAYTA
jgi:polyhydroxyalkanoate synthesis regulator phasin